MLLFLKVCIFNLFSLLLSFFVPGEGSEEIGNMIQNYIKEIEELRLVCRFKTFTRSNATFTFVF